MSIAPPLNKTLWPELALDLSILLSYSKNKINREGAGEHFQTAKKFRNCLETLASPGNAKYFGCVLEGMSYGGVHNNISYMDIESKIRDFAKSESLNYEAVFRSLREAIALILKRRVSSDKEELFKKFINYVSSHPYSSKRFI